ncbi:conserved hypothetical protein [Ricinus communis]|uniref:Uncharacterized protein n=1 Tax=Ricinus communis TaxID=3988 RepID=B9THW0_RICCO|nr:conserved hypothetical protein [Ricinus communis]
MPPTFSWRGLGLGDDLAIGRGQGCLPHRFGHATKRQLDVAQWLQLRLRHLLDGRNRRRQLGAHDVFRRADLFQLPANTLDGSAECSDDLRKLRGRRRQLCGGVVDRRHRLLCQHFEDLVDLLAVALGLTRDLLETFRQHLVADAPVVREFARRGVELGAHAPRHFRKLVAHAALDVDRISPHLVEEDAQRHAGNGRSDGDAEIADNGLDRCFAGKEVERHAKAREGEEKPHVIKVVARLLVVQPEPGNGQRHDEVDPHQHQRHAGHDRQRPPHELRRPDEDHPADGDGGEKHHRPIVPDEISGVSVSHQRIPSRRTKPSKSPLLFLIHCAQKFARSSMLNFMFGL